MKKKAIDSFSGIPATVLDKKAGIIVINKVDIEAIIPAFIALCLSSFLIKISLTKRKKEIIVNAKNITGINAPAKLML
jgi:hypothetical protein